MTGNQLQAARNLIGWNQAQLAEASGLSVPTIKRAEGSGRVAASAKAVEAIRAALEAHGVQFLEAGGVAQGPGIAVKGE
ncbi:MAG: helix-turn-helix domain-containing protein [Mangrovicoccus sp.]|nr:helix-turn-helix domain-containing protein [Mangrovicoccus sp.]